MCACVNYMVCVCLCVCISARGGNENGNVSDVTMYVHTCKSIIIYVHVM